MTQAESDNRAIGAIAEAAQKRQWRTVAEKAAELARREPGAGASLEPMPLEQLLAPIAPPEYHVEAFDAAPGRPSSIVGMGYSLKTLSAQSMAVATAGGKDVWGAFPARHGPVAWFDYEMGPKPTLRRMRRLAAGMGLDWAALATHLRVYSLPKLYLNSAGFEDALKRAIDGCVAAFLDSFRRSLPGEDENSSDVARFLDILMRVSEEMGVTFWFIHHATTKTKATEGQDTRGSGRGSSAIFDGSGSVLNFAGKRGEPVTVQQIRTCEGAIAVPDFQLVIEDVDGGLRLTASTIETVDPDVVRREKAQALRDQIVAAVAASPGGISRNEICASLMESREGVRKTTILNHIVLLIKERRLMQIGSGPTTAVALDRASLNGTSDVGNH